VSGSNRRLEGLQTLTMRFPMNCDLQDHVEKCRLLVIYNRHQRARWLFPLGYEVNGRRGIGRVRAQSPRWRGLTRRRTTRGGPFHVQQLFFCHLSHEKDRLKM
jgi:hypothetical protein